MANMVTLRWLIKTLFIVLLNYSKMTTDIPILNMLTLCSYQALTFPSSLRSGAGGAAVDLRFSLHLPPTKLFHPSEKRAKCYIITKHFGIIELLI